ncbi:hypothetical protein IFR05_017368, partial [Cadophora sp. M221]
MEQQPDVNNLWLRHQKRSHQSTRIWSCTFCPDRRIFASESTLWAHALADHRNQLAFGENGDVLEDSKQTYIRESEEK